MRLRVATANVQVRLPREAARVCIESLLAEDVDLIALQECSPARALLLREYGDLRFVPGPVHICGSSRTRYHWVQTIGDCSVGVRADRFEIEHARPLLLAGFTRGESPTRPFGIEPAQVGLVVRCRERASGERVSLIDYHLIPGVQAGGAYRTDRPRLVARHRHQVVRLARTIAAEKAAGWSVFAAGDGNFDGLALPGLTSAWSSRPPGEGTYGSRRIDDVFGPGPADSVRLLDTPSDHRAVVVAY